MRNFVIKVFACALLVLVCSGTGTFASSNSLSSEVTLTPASKPGAFLASVEIRDSVSQELLSAPRISFMKGGPTETSTTLPSGEKVTFTIEVNAAGTKATYAAEIQKDGKSLGLQKATITLSQ